MNRFLVCVLAILPGLAATITGLAVPAWSAIVAGAAIGGALALAAAVASALADGGSSLAALGWRLAAVFIRLAGTALAMTALARDGGNRPAIAALLAAVILGWLAEMAGWALRLAQERKPARA